MSPTIRIGFTKGGPREPGYGGHVGLFHAAGRDGLCGRVISVGYLRFDRSDLEPLREEGAKLRVTAVGVLRLGPDVTPALAEAVFDRVRLVGWRMGHPQAHAAARSSASKAG